jgi:6-phosphogluconolactonase
MTFRKSGQILLALVVSFALGFGVTSCTKDFTVAFLYVTGSAANGTSSQSGQIGGFKVDNDTGFLRPISGQPFGSSGTNPIRALVFPGGSYLYVLNAGTSSTDSSGNITYAGANISVFSIGGAGSLSFQQNYSSKGLGSQRLAVDSSGKYLYVLDEYATDLAASVPAAATYSTTAPCQDSTGAFRPVGDITVFGVDPTTGRLTLILNNQLTDPIHGGQLPYFPVGCFPVDFHASSSFIHTVDAGSPTNNTNGTTGDLESVFVYALSSATGQLTLSQNTPLLTGADRISAIGADSASKFIYLLDAGANGGSGQILPYTIGTNGALTILSGGGTPNDPVAADPVALTTDSKSKFLYVANAAGAQGVNTAGSYITAFTINSSSGVLQELSGSPFGTGSGPRCIIEDTSNQYIYTADNTSGTVTGHILDPNSGVITVLKKGSTFQTVNQPTWCVDSSRVN